MHGLVAAVTFVVVVMAARFRSVPGVVEGSRKPGKATARGLMDPNDIARPTSLPQALQAQGVLEVGLDDSRTAQIPCCMPRFERWTGAPVQFPFGGKALVVHAQQPLWAEFKIMSLFREAGWDALVVQTFGRIHYLEEMKRGHDDRGVALPDSARSLSARITAQNGGSGGFFDVFAWRGREVVFAEAKLTKKDRLRATQKRWIASALAVGVPIESLLIVEWTLGGHESAGHG